MKNKILLYLEAAEKIRAKLRAGESAIAPSPASASTPSPASASILAPDTASGPTLAPASQPAMYPPAVGDGSEMGQPAPAAATPTNLMDLEDDLSSLPPPPANPAADAPSKQGPSATSRAQADFSKPSESPPNAGLEAHAPVDSAGPGSRLEDIKRALHTLSMADAVNHTPSAHRREAEEVGDVSFHPAEPTPGDHPHLISEPGMDNLESCDDLKLPSVPLVSPTAPSPQAKRSQPPDDAPTARPPTSSGLLVDFDPLCTPGHAGSTVSQPPCPAPAEPSTLSAEEYNKLQAEARAQAEETEARISALMRAGRNTSFERDLDMACSDEELETTISQN